MCSPRPFLNKPPGFSSFYYVFASFQLLYALRIIYSYILLILTPTFPISFLILPYIFFFFFVKFLSRFSSSSYFWYSSIYSLRLFFLTSISLFLLFRATKFSICNIHSKSFFITDGVHCWITKEFFFFTNKMCFSFLLSI